MSIEKVTPRPALYLEEPEAWEWEALRAKEEENWKRLSAGKCWVAAELHRKGRFARHFLSAPARKAAAELVATVLGEEAVFERKKDLYRVGGWTVTGQDVVSELYKLTNRARCGRVFSVLDEAGYQPNGEVSILFRPEEFGIESLDMLTMFFERKAKYLEKRLGLADEPRLVVYGDEIGFFAPMERFQPQKIEESLLMFETMIQMAKLQRAGKAG